MGIALAVTGVVGGGVAFVRWRSGSAPAPGSALTMTALTTGGRAAEQTIDGSVSISPDGKYVSYAALDAQQKSSLWTRLVGTQSQLQIVPPAEVFFNGTTFSPDGAFVYDCSGKGGAAAASANSGACR